MSKQSTKHKVRSALNIAIQMDPPASLQFATDTTVRLGLEAQARGYTLWYYTPDKLTYDKGDIVAQASRIAFHNNPEHFFDIGESARLDLRMMDVVLLRQDPPFDMAYITTTYLLEMLVPQVLVANAPASVRNLPEKLFPAQFKEFMPPTLVTANMDEMVAFHREYKDIVVKPLYGFAGHGVRRITAGDALPEPQGDMRMLQPFLPEVKTGDRRIILVDGEVGGIMARIPAEEEFRANFRVGGHAEPATMTARQQAMCEALKPALKTHGLILAGIDCIGDYLTEINITSPTGIPAMNRLCNLTLEARVWDAIERRL